MSEETVDPYTKAGSFDPIVIVNCLQKLVNSWQRPAQGRSVPLYVEYSSTIVSAPQKNLLFLVSKAAQNAVIAIVDIFFTHLNIWGYLHNMTANVVILRSTVLVIHFSPDSKWVHLLNRYDSTFVSLFSITLSSILFVMAEKAVNRASHKIPNMQSTWVTYAVHATWLVCVLFLSRAIEST